MLALGIAERLKRLLLPPAVEIGAAQHIEKSVAAATVDVRPFPHLIAENVFPVALLEEIRQNWPDSAALVRDMPGSYSCDPRQLIEDGTGRREYWCNFSNTHALALLRASLVQYADWIVARYGRELDQFVVMSFNLMQVDADYRGHRYHTHHYHDPFMIATLLVYIDEQSGGQPGTTVTTFVTPPGRDPHEYGSWFAARHLYGEHAESWVDSFTVSVKTIDYKANRLFSFLDGPISYHAVKPPELGSFGKRRVMRIHVGTPPSFYDRLYGVSFQEYQKSREGPSDDPKVIEWLRRDIDQIWNTAPSMSLEQRLEFVRRISIDISAPPLGPD